MARSGRSSTRERQASARQHDGARGPQDLFAVLARAVREVQTAVERRRVTPSVRTKFQVIALLVRDEHARVTAKQTGSQTDRAERLKRLDGIATILAKTAVRDTALLSLLADDAPVSDAAKALKREMQQAAGIEPAVEEPEPEVIALPSGSERRVVPQSVAARQLAIPFLAHRP